MYILLYSWYDVLKYVALSVTNALLMPIAKKVAESDFTTILETAVLSASATHIEPSSVAV